MQSILNKFASHISQIDSTLLDKKNKIKIPKILTDNGSSNF